MLNGVLIKMKKRDLLSLVIFIITPQVAGLIGAVATAPAISSWYVYLNKPFFTPPGWLFGPAWTLLYLLMGISAYLVYQKGFRDEKVKHALYLFAVQLGLNILWSFIFFGFKLPLPAFAEIVVLWVFIYLTIKAFLKLDKTAGYLMVPYLAWVTFASLLNFAVALMN